MYEKDFKKHYEKSMQAIPFEWYAATNASEKSRNLSKWKFRMPQTFFLLS